MYQIKEGVINAMAFLKRAWEIKPQTLLYDWTIVVYSPFIIILIILVKHFHIKPFLI